MALAMWKQVSADETMRVKKLLTQAKSAEVKEVWISAYVYGCRRYLEGVLTALKPSMDGPEIAQAESEFDILIGDLEKPI